MWDHGLKSQLIEISIFFKTSQQILYIVWSYASTLHSYKICEIQQNCYKDLFINLKKSAVV